MIAVAIMAALLALPSGWRELAAALSLPCVALLAARHLFLWDQRRLAGFCFWVPAVLSNVLYATLCICPEGYFLTFLCFAWLLFILPTLAGFGVTWVSLATQEVAAARHVPFVSWMVVVASTAMPFITACTLWPCRLAFLTARPALERLADRVAAGQTIKYPFWAGPFRVAGSVVDPTLGNVGLMIDPNSNGPTGFVRNRGPQSDLFGCPRPIRGDVLHIGLGDGWCYHEED
jgi:hypothetical protein